MRRKGEVVNLQARVRFETGLLSDYDYSKDLKIDELHITFPPSAGINPGDLVTFEMTVQAPEMQRFVPALEVGSTDDDEDGDV